jgi:hypothetical protein
MVVTRGAGRLLRGNLIPLLRELCFVSTHSVARAGLRVPVAAGPGWTTTPSPARRRSGRRPGRGPKCEPRPTARVRVMDAVDGRELVVEPRRRTGTFPAQVGTPGGAVARPGLSRREGLSYRVAAGPDHRSDSGGSVPRVHGGRAFRCHGHGQQSFGQQYVLRGSCGATARRDIGGTTIVATPRWGSAVIELLRVGAWWEGKAERRCLYLRSAARHRAGAGAGLPSSFNLTMTTLHPLPASQNAYVSLPAPTWGVPYRATTCRWDTR